MYEVRPISKILKHQEALILFLAATAAIQPPATEVIAPIPRRAHNIDIVNEKVGSATTYSGQLNLISKKLITPTAILANLHVIII